MFWANGLWALLSKRPRVPDASFFTSISPQWGSLLRAQALQPRGEGRLACHVHLSPHMKSLTLAVALLVGMFGSQTARADELLVARSSTAAPNLLLINPGALLNGVVAIEYERALNSFFGLDFGLSVSTFRGVFTPTDRANVVAFGPEVGVRFHFIKDAPGGLWIGPSLSGAYITSGNSTRTFGWGLTGAVGYNFLLGDHFALQLGIGGGFKDYGDGIEWGPHFRLGLGGRF